MKKQPPQKIYIGLTLESNNFGTFKVIGIDGYNKITIKFLTTGYVNVVSSDQARNGRVRDAMKPSVYGVGFLGDGPHATKSGPKHTKEYKVWHDMMMRCYSPDCQEEHPSYIGCAVADDWHNFQNFASWYKDNSTEESRKYEIDKDLLSPNNKVYSKDFCILIPKFINGFLTDRVAQRGALPIGVTKDKSGKYISRCCNPLTGNRDYLGIYDDPIKAHMAWRLKKSNLMSQIINAQSDKRIKCGLLEYKRMLDEFEIYKDGFTK